MDRLETELFMAASLREIEAELATMKWELIDQQPSGMGHYTGRGAKWTVQLVVLHNDFMATATTGSVMVKLTDDLAKKTERAARCST